MVWAAASAGAGFGTGWIASIVLRRSARPAPVSRWWCAFGTAGSWLGVWWLWLVGAFPGWWSPIPLVATALAVPLIAVDLRYLRLPDVVTLTAYPLAAGALVVSAVGGPGPPLAVVAVASAAVVGGLHLLVHRLAPHSLGAGDVKLAGSAGALMGAAGWPTVVVTVVGAALITAVVALGAALARSRRWRDGVPYGPGLLLATCVGVLLPGELPEPALSGGGGG